MSPFRVISQNIPPLFPFPEGISAAPEPFLWHRHMMHQPGKDPGFHPHAIFSPSRPRRIHISPRGGYSSLPNLSIS